jgi:putative spermidine/putrescine transport system substrate-binding protein
MAAFAVCTVALCAVAAGCGGGSSSGGTGGGGGNSSGMITHIGQGEGQLNLVIWEGYAENGQHEKDVNWVTPFEQQTGCQVHVKNAASSDEMVQLMEADGGKDWDGVSASGDATNRLIAAKAVAPIDVNLFPDFKQLLPALQSPPHNTVDGVHYGVSWMWGANVLMYNTKVVKPAPDSWSVVFGNDYPGKITAYASPIYIADAALYLKSHDPSLGIDDPYELTEPQLDAAVNLLKQQHANIKKYWALFADETQLFKQGDVVAGQAWPYAVSFLQHDHFPVASVIPKEGVTGWADTWMMSSHAQHPNCMLKWMNYSLDPAVQAQTAAWVTYNPANPQACNVKPLTPAFCTSLHENDPAYFKQIAFWKTPLPQCGNGQNDCTAYSEWEQKWTDITGG